MIKVIGTVIFATLGIFFAAVVLQWLRKFHSIVIVCDITVYDMINRFLPECGKTIRRMEFLMNLECAAITMTGIAAIVMRNYLIGNVLSSVCIVTGLIFMVLADRHFKFVERVFSVCAWVFSEITEQKLKQEQLGS